jgi:hypothetical protein
VYAAAELLLTAEKELGAFCAAVSELYGPERSGRAAAIWIEILEAFGLPSNDAPPNLRSISILAAARLASFILQSD